MGRVAVVTDSTACLPKDVAKELGIPVVPVDLVFENRVYRNGLDSMTGEFYTLLKQAKRLPTTSAPTPGAYLEVYQKASEGAEGILCVTASAKISAMFDSARQARELAKEALPNIPINVIDSATATMAQGFIVLAAARAAARGQSLAQVTQIAERMKPRVYMILTMDTLYYLAKGGRIPKAAAWAGQMLSIKPIIHLADGEVALLERTRTKPRAVERMLELMGQRLSPREPAHVGVIHANVPEEAERLKARVASEFDCVELYVTEFTPVMGTHTGPGALGLGFYGGE